MVPLGLLSIAVVSLAIRNFMIFNRNKLLRPDLLPQIEELMAHGDIGACQELCRSQPCILTAVVDAGLERVVTEEIDIDAVKEGGRTGRPHADDQVHQGDQLPLQHRCGGPHARAAGYGIRYDQGLLGPVPWAVPANPKRWPPTFPKP